MDEYISASFNYSGSFLTTYLKIKYEMPNEAQDSRDGWMNKYYRKGYHVISVVGNKESTTIVMKLKHVDELPETPEIEDMIL